MPKATTSQLGRNGSIAWQHPGVKWNQELTQANMAYTTNPQLPKLRAKAVDMVQQGNAMRQVARYFGYEPSTIMRWCKRVPLPLGVREIPTRSSRPHHHPAEITQELVNRIKELRGLTDGRCAEVIHQMLLNEDNIVSLSTVKRVLDRTGMTKKKNPFRRRWTPIARPYVTKEGDLVQIDTIHLAENGHVQLYIYTLLDVFSRWAYARAVAHIGANASLEFIQQACSSAPFDFKCLQSDHGSEFSKTFTQRIKIKHRHSRVRRPNDNAHLERFNRTIQTELLNKIPLDVQRINRELPGYLKYYNEERLHLGLNLKTPTQVLRSY